MFRVAFHWLEAEPGAGHGTPPELIEKFDRHRLVMRGTQAREPRCVALLGTVGDRAACGIYAQRPSPCRELAPAWEDGRPSPQCDRARLRHGLPVLTAQDWPIPDARVAADLGTPELGIGLTSAVAAVDLDQQFASADLGMQQQSLH